MALWRLAWSVLAAMMGMRLPDTPNTLEAQLAEYAAAPLGPLSSIFQPRWMTFKKAIMSCAHLDPAT